MHSIISAPAPTLWWKHIWGMPLLPKFRMFCWKLLHDALPLCGILHAREIPVNPPSLLQDQSFALWFTTLVFYMGGLEVGTLLIFTEWVVRHSDALASEIPLLVLSISVEEPELVELLQLCIRNYSLVFGLFRLLGGGFFLNPILYPDSAVLASVQRRSYSDDISYFWLIDVIRDIFLALVHVRFTRQHGYNMPCDVFYKFTNNKGKFKESSRSDERGMLSLYEAAHLRIHDEHILEEALTFTTDFLNSISTFSEQARLALKQPLHRGNQRWCKNLELARKFPHLRQRQVEYHYLSIIMYYVPQYSLARILFSKLLVLLSFLDDTYDAYGTFEELECLANAFERWDLMEKFSANYMKILYEFVITTLDDVAKEMTKIGKPYAGFFAKEQVKRSIRNYYTEIKWVKSKYVPTFEEYMFNGRNTAGMQIIGTILLMGMEEIAEAKPYIQLMQYTTAITASSNICRLMDDMTTGKAELARGVRLASSVECYMNDYSMSHEEVLQVFKKIIDDAWKDLVNEGLLINPCPHDYDHLSKPVYDRMLNLARAAESFYKFGDGLTFVKTTIKEDIVAIYAQPFSI
ncbi:(-)-germacrene D synthase-like [Chenopodium quinoa]|uniref:(-)-germacrene D synthase-like n=1 Tax=Chenopodium quinoa TaxID=63459 RepID=UPI000B7710FC|nr:(-)-germacrene D synthase-like [Chenopodium quinoa]